MAGAGVEFAVKVERLGAFPPATPLLALPNWRTPRLLLMKSGSWIQRWRSSAFYPATRARAKVYRLAMRSKAAIGWGEVRQAGCDYWALGEFVADCLPGMASVAMQTRPLGLAQKFTIEIRDRVGTVIGYLKYGVEPLAQRRLTQEHAMLTRLPAGFGPIPLKFGNLGDGTALLVAPLRGQDVRAGLRPPPELLEFIRSLEVSAPFALDAHPYIRGVREAVGTQLDTIFADLADRAWPIALHHGDLAPWNLRWNRYSRSLSAFDWEYGTPEGFPYTDLAYFVLQTAFLIYSWPAAKSAIYATQWLGQQPTLGLADREARALTRLAMFDAYRRAKAEGCTDEDPFQAWRLYIWRGSW